MKRTFLLSWLLFWGVVLSAQTKPETLTNTAVINLHKAGLDEEIILTKIESSDCKFDLSTNGLIALQKAGMPKAVISAMQRKSSVKSAGSVPNGSTSTQGASKSSARANSSRVSVPETINHVHFLDKATGGITPLERATATMKTRNVAFGLGGADLTYELSGDKSPVRTAEANMPGFIVKTGSGPADAFVLHKLEVKRGKRLAVAAQYGKGLTGVKGAKGIITLDVREIKPGVYELVPASPLEKGEYFFALKTSGNALSTDASVYAFGID